MTDKAIADMNKNFVVAVASERVSVFKKDTVLPTLQNYEFNLDTRTVTLTFSETMNATTLTPAAFTLQSEKDITGKATKWNQFTITKATTSTTNSHVLTFTFSVEDANHMKIRTSICSADTNTFLRLTDAGAKDMNGNDVVAVTSDIAVKAFKFVADTTSPRLVDFDVAMPTLAPPILVTVVFSETVLTNDMNASGFIFADGAGGSQAHCTVGTLRYAYVRINTHAR